MKIVIVDDDRTIAKALAMFLLHRHSDVKVTEISNGRDFMNYYTLKSKTISVILLDIIMPVSDGFEVLRFLNERHNTVPIIVLSNLSNVQKTEYPNAGICDILVKAETHLVDIDDLIKKIVKK